MFNPENFEKIIRDKIEGPPNMESVRTPETSSEQRDQLLNEHLESEPSGPQRVITKDEAHQIGLALLSKDEFVKGLKRLTKEKIARGERITRLDIAIFNQEISNEPHGLSREHLIEKLDENFLKFDIVRDGDDLALSFQKSSGDRALRSFDDTALTDIIAI